MFSIAAINDTDSKGQWEPLAPTKEAQEFHLSQTYHDGLLQLQAKEYLKAQELLESVLKDPLISSAKVDNKASDGHLLQLRFLALKNLASVFLQQGSMHYESAIRCYLQAVEIDVKDSVVWNRLGTLSCEMGLLSTARWAFEQGLYCSPNNWNCMEKLLEVLIAIGDEVSCLSIAELILRHWPSHSRALLVKNTIDELEQTPFSPHGIDKLEPVHARLKFPAKRKLNENDADKNSRLKRHTENIEIHLSQPSWSALLDTILNIMRGRGSEPGIGDDPVHSDKLGGRRAKLVGRNTEEISGGTIKELEKYNDVRIRIHLSSGSEAVSDPATGKGLSTVQISSENVSHSDYGSEKSSIVKEKESVGDEEHPQERRSTRLERLRSRKPGKDELDFATGKDRAKLTIQLLERFIAYGIGQKDFDYAAIDSVSDLPSNTSDTEYNDITGFIVKTSNNYGVFHMAHLLLEEISHKSLPYNENYYKLLDLEKLTRCWSQDRTHVCSLFLAELYYVFGTYSANDTRRSELFSEASYNLCKVMEVVIFDSPAHLCPIFSSDKGFGISSVMSDFGKGTIDLNHSIIGVDNVESGSQDLFPPTSSFWVRFYWLSGRLSASYGDKEKSYEEFCISLSLLNNITNVNGGSVGFIPLPHCKLVKGLSAKRIMHEINLLKVDELLRETTGKMIEKGMYSKVMNLLSPLLLFNNDIYLDLLPNAQNEDEGVSSIELLALDVLILACEKAKGEGIDEYLSSHRRKLQILTIYAGMVESPTSYTALHKKSMPKTSFSASEFEGAENMGKFWKSKMAEEVKEISQCASQVKELIDERGSSDDYTVTLSILGDIQSLLLTIMCNIVRGLCSKPSSLPVTNQGEQHESRCFVDAAIAFCKLQHLDPKVPVKTQVELIVAIHELLAEYGLCCAGNDGEGEEGTFLKLAIKHLLALDMKLKSSFHFSCSLETKKDTDSFSDNGHSSSFLRGSKPIPSPDLETGTVEKEQSAEDMIPETLSSFEAPDTDDEGAEREMDGKLHHSKGQKSSGRNDECGNHPCDSERKNVELGIDNALDQCFFCLYGLNLRSGPDSSAEDDLAVHNNTNRGDFQTKDQCADVFRYLLPYAKASSRAGLVKLRKVLRAIRKQFPKPPEDVLAENSIDKFLDNLNLCEDELREITGSSGSLESVINIVFPNGRGLKAGSTLSGGSCSSEPYLEVYGNLYFFQAQAEEMSATDKWPGFVLTEEGEEFIEQNANLFKYDLLYNPLRFESWQRLANIYDEEVDLMLNDGSKHINVVEWRKQITLSQRVEVSRRRCRRCLLMSLALAKTPAQQSQIHELLALVDYDSIQNVVPFYDQRSIIPVRDAAWTLSCQNSMKHFERAFDLKPDWSHAFYLGKLCEKLGHSCEKAFSYYSKAALINPSAVDPVYRMHASRLKLLYTCGKKNLYAIRVVTAYSFHQSTKETVTNLLGWTSEDLMELPMHNNETAGADGLEHRREQVEEAWNALFSDCVSALEVCVEGELKHFHKARYMLAQGLYRRGGTGDLERAKDELSFCFRSSRSSFTINMWEIDSMVKKGRRKTPGLGGNSKGLELSLPESSRKFITCIRKYTLLYLSLLEKTGDFGTLERAYVSLRADKRFSLCLEDIVPVALWKYFQALSGSIKHTETLDSSGVIPSLEHLLERTFNLFMDHGNLWTDITSLPELKALSSLESSSKSSGCSSLLYSYIHKYIESLENNVRVDMLEGINERIRKRFKNPKLSNNNCTKICKHASAAWCRSILINLALITPLQDEMGSLVTQCSGQVVVAGNDSDYGMQQLPQLLHVDLQPNNDVLWSWSFEDPANQLKMTGLEEKWGPVLSRIKNVHVKQALAANMETATNLLRCAYNFYRESYCGTLPSGIINLFTKVPVPSRSPSLAPPSGGGGDTVVDLLDLSIPRKLLLWAYTLVHGRYSNILVVVKHCEENTKSRMKRGPPTSSASSHTTVLPTCTTAQAGTVASGGKEKSNADNECGETEDNPLSSRMMMSSSSSASAFAGGDAVHGSATISVSGETHKVLFSSTQALQHCNTTPSISKEEHLGQE